MVCKSIVHEFVDVTFQETCKLSGHRKARGFVCMDAMKSAFTHGNELATVGAVIVQCVRIIKWIGNVTAQRMSHQM